jgi:hypothetical protein
MMLAVRINCEGDVCFLDRPVYQVAREPEATRYLKSEIHTPTADKLGIPLVVRELPPALL